MNILKSLLYTLCFLILVISADAQISGGQPYPVTPLEVAINQYSHLCIDTDSHTIDYIPETHLKLGKMGQDAVEYIFTEDLDHFSINLTPISNFSNSQLRVELVIGGETYSIEQSGSTGIVDLEGTLVGMPISANDNISLGYDDGHIILEVNGTILNSIPVGTDVSNARVKLNPLFADNACYWFHMDVDYRRPLSYVNFVDENVLIQEGEVLPIVLDLTSTNESADPFSVVVSILDSKDPHFSSTLDVTISIPPDTLGPIVYDLPSELANQLKDNNRRYKFEIKEVIGQHAGIGEQNFLNVEIIDDFVPFSNNLAPGDMMFVGFETDIGNAEDQIIVTNLTELNPGTSFQVSSGRYQANLNRFVGPVTGFSSIRFEYNGAEPLPINTILCIYTGGRDTTDRTYIDSIAINGTVSNELFAISNEGSTNLNSIEIDTDDRKHLFLVQGQWVHQPGQSFLNGKVLNGIAVGDFWSIEELPTGNTSNEHPDIECLGIQGPTGPGSFWGYYQCDVPYGTTTVFNLQKQIQEFGNWTSGSGDTLKNWPPDIDVCSSTCEIVDECLELAWVVEPQDIGIYCDDPDAFSKFAVWRSSIGYGTFLGGCEPFIIGYELIGSSPDTCNNSAEYLYIITDVDGRSISASAFYDILDTIPPDFSSAPTMITISCDEDYEIVVNDNCGSSVEVTYSEVLIDEDFGTYQTIEREYTATDICGNSSVFVQEIIKLQDQLFVDFPADTIGYCSFVDFPAPIEIQPVFSGLAGSVDYFWILKSTGDTLFDAAISFFASGSDVVYLLGENAEGCQVKDSVVILNQDFDINLQSQYDVCQNDIVNLQPTITGYDGNLSFLWTDNIYGELEPTYQTFSTQSSFNWDASYPPTIYLFVSDANCSSRQAINFIFQDGEVAINQLPSSCPSVFSTLLADIPSNIVAQQIQWQGFLPNFWVTVSNGIAYNYTSSQPFRMFRLQVTDIDGCVYISETLTIDESDSSLPTASCNDITLNLDAFGSSNILPTDIDNGSLDNCGTVTLGLDQSTFDCTNLGENTVTLTVSDGAGNMNTCQATVTVLDTISPIIACPANLTVALNDQGEYSMEDFTISAIGSDNCFFAIGQNPILGSVVSDTGHITVQLDVNDSSLNANACTFDLFVIDTSGFDCGLFTFNYFTNGPGQFSFDDILYNGTTLTDFVIRWENASGDTLFRSGGGVFFDPNTMYSHPQEDIPFTGSIKPILELSNESGEYDCFTEVIVQDIDCASGFQTDHYGPGGIVTDFFMIIDPENPVIKFEYDDQDVADNLEIIYNGLVIFSSLDNALLRTFVAEIPYDGANSRVCIRVTNSDPTVVTRWDFELLSCCDQIESFSEFPDSRVSAILATNNGGCESYNFLTWSGMYCSGITPEEICNGYSILPTINSQTLGQKRITSSVSALTTECINANGMSYKIVNKLHTITFLSQSPYDQLKTYLQNPEIPSLINHQFSIRINNNNCADDNDVTIYAAYPNVIQYVYDDLNLTISADYNTANPFDQNACVSSNNYNGFNSISSEEDLETFGNSFFVRAFQSREVFDLERNFSASYNFQDTSFITSYKLVATDTFDIPNSWTVYKRNSITFQYDIPIQNYLDPLGCPNPDFPQPNCPNDTILIVDNGCDFLIPDFTMISATDNIDNPGDIVVTQSIPVDSIVNGIEEIGVIVSFTDTDGNINTCGIIVTPIDTIKPYILCPPDDEGFLDQSGVFVIPDYINSSIAGDNCSFAVIQTPSAGTVLSTAGTHNIKLNIVDDSNNVDSCDFDLILGDCALFNFNYFSNGPGQLSFDELYYDGSLVGDFVIRWENENGDTLFRSGGGVNYDPVSMYGHPISDIIVSGTLFPIIETSQIGNAINCFDSIIVDNITCFTTFDPGEQTNPGGVVTEFFIEIDPLNPVIKFYFDDDNTADDELLVLYNDAVVLNTTNYPNFRNFAAAIPYDGIESKVLVRVTSVSPESTTSNWTFRLKECCESIEGIGSLSDGSISSVEIIHEFCNSRFFNFQTPLFCSGINIESVCNGYRSSSNTFYIILGEYATSSTRDTFYDDRCVDAENVQLNINNQLHTLQIDSLEVYNELKNLILHPSIINNINYNIRLQIESLTCADDSDLLSTIYLFPYAGNISFDDVLQTIQSDFSVSNPYNENDCIESNLYEDFDNMVVRSNTSIIGNSFQRIVNEEYEVVRNSRTFSPQVILQTETYSSSYLLSYTDIDNIETSWTLYKQDPVTLLYDIVIQTHLDPLGCSPGSQALEAETRVSKLNSPSIYPNPASNKFFLEYNSDRDQVSDLFLFNMAGELVRSSKVDFEKGNNVSEVDTRDFVPGMYLVKLRTTYQEFIEKVVIVKN